MNAIIATTKYLGHSVSDDWVAAGQAQWYDQQLMLTLTEGSAGTLISSTKYVWYGKITARLRTSAGAGVVTSFILYADSKDEIDFEFVGSQLDSSQLSYYSQGLPSELSLDAIISTQLRTGIVGITQTSNVSSNTRQYSHEYEIDWNPDTITWSIDGTVARTLNREDTWNAAQVSLYVE